MALLARSGGVLAFEFVAGQIVIEFLQRCWPLDQVGRFSVVLEMAFHTIFAIGIAHLDLEMITMLRGEIVGDFFMAIEAFERGRHGAEGVACCALAGSI